MQKKNLLNILMYSTLALIIPFLGNLFVDGWSWGWNDFLFAWIFFIVFGLTYKFVTTKITNRTHRIISGIIVIVVFVCVWVMLATG